MKAFEIEACGKKVKIVSPLIYEQDHQCHIVCFHNGMYEIQTMIRPRGRTFLSSTWFTPEFLVDQDPKSIIDSAKQDALDLLYDTDHIEAIVYEQSIP